MSHLTVRTRSVPGGPLIELVGELDHDSAPDVRDHLSRTSLEAGQQLIVDLAGITFCDSSGITVLIAARNLTLQAHADLALAAVPDRLHRILRIVGLDKVFPTHPTAQAAADAWKPLGA
ncbi:STAS domain-containing protein [Streptomyces sp. NPDC048392]|uniref:STAS domain-containing protein n=1 Tax=Streptomyces sp. NPDC048392 TaxID=3365543 RepID=UPI003721EFCC